MKKIAILYVLLGILVCACAAPQPKPGSEWTGAKDAITLNLKVDSKLNFKNKKPHTLMLCVYQLKDSAAFNKLVRDRSGLYELLECQILDLSIATANRIIANPGRDVHMTIDRAEGARYVAVIAGYYAVEKEKIVRFYEIPYKEKQSWFSKTKTIKPQNLEIKLTLGALQLYDPRPGPEKK